MIISKATNGEKYLVFCNCEEGIDFLKEAFGFSAKYRECYLKYLIVSYSQTLVMNGMFLDYNRSVILIF